MCILHSPAQSLLPDAAQTLTVTAVLPKGKEQTRSTAEVVLAEKRNNPNHARSLGVKE